MKDRRHRKGYREGAMSEELRTALRKELVRIRGIKSTAERVTAVGDLLAAIDVEVGAAGDLRLDAITELREIGMTYEAIASATGLSLPRVSQLARAAEARKEPGCRDL